MSQPPGALTSGQREWLRVRSYLQEHRHELGQAAAAEYPAERTIAGTGLLTVPGWQPARPVPLQDISLTLNPAPAPASAPGDAGADADGDGAVPVPPGRPNGTRYLRYSDAVRELAAPAIFEDRPTYRLTDAELAGPAPRLGFTRGRYFDGIDTGEAAAHEYAALRLAEHPPPARPASARPAPARPASARPASARPSSPLASLRGRLGDPCDLRRRPVNLAISTLTLRLDSSSAGPRSCCTGGIRPRWRTRAACTR